MNDGTDGATDRVACAHCGGTDGALVEVVIRLRHAEQTLAACPEHAQAVALGPHLTDAVAAAVAAHDSRPG